MAIVRLVHPAVSGARPAWTDARNWAGGVAPVPADTLIFGPTSFQFSTQNTFAAGTAFEAMDYPGGFYLQTGNAIALTNGVTANGGSANIALPIALNQSQTFTAAAGSLLQFAGGTIATSGNTLTLGGAGGILWPAPSPAPGGITVQGTGTYTLAGNHPYTGDTQVSSSTLTIGGTFAGSQFVLGFNAFLRGAGSVKGLSLSPSSTVDPGAASNGTGILSSTADLQFVLGSLAVDIKGLTPGTQHDQLNVTGAVRLSNQLTAGLPSLLVTLPAFEPNDGDSFTIVLNDGADPVEGTFNSLPEGASFDVPDGGGPGSTTTFFITYRGGDGNDIVLHVPAIRIWDGGGGGDNKWRTAANWTGDIAPQVGDSFTFRQARCRRMRPTSTTFLPTPRSAQLMFLGAGFTLTGNSIRVSIADVRSVRQ